MGAEVNISSYSGSVSGGNWAPAVAAAKAALANGGQINIDADVDLTSGCSFVDGGSNYRSWTFHGNAGNRIKLDAAGSDAFSFGNCLNVMFRDIPFRGRRFDNVSPTTRDANSMATASGTERLIFENCRFNGMNCANGTITGSNALQTIIDRCKFGSGGGPVAHINITSGGGLIVKNTDFIDYANYLADYYDRQVYPPQWIKAVASSLASSSYVPFVHIEDCSFDEGAAESINITGYQEVHLERVHCNAGSGVSPAVYLEDVQQVRMIQPWIGFQAGKDLAIKLVNCGDVWIDQMQVHSGLKRIEVDAYTRLRVTNSPGVVIDRV